MSLKENILKEAKRVIEDTTFSSEGHFIAAARWAKWHNGLGVLAAILAFVSGSSAIAAYNLYSVAVGLLAIIAGTVAAILTFIKPHERATLHHTAGTNYRQLRNETRIFSEIDYLKDDENELIKKIKELSSKRDALNQSSPQVPNWAYKKAKQQIEGSDKTTQYAADKD